MLPWLTCFLQQNFRTLQLIVIPFPVLAINLRPYLKYGFFREGWLWVEFKDLVPQLSRAFRHEYINMVSYATPVSVSISDYC